MNTDFDHFKLKIDWKPSAYHGFTVRKSVSQNLWKKIRLEVLKNNQNTCSICGYKPSEEIDLKRLHVHEVEEYGESELICTLKGLNLICVKCHAFHHLGRTFGALNKDQIEDLMNHFTAVNNCTEQDFKEYYRFVRDQKRQNEPSILELLEIFNEEDTVKFFIDGNIPYKEDVISQLKKKGLYREIENKRPISEHFVRYILKGEKFNFNDFKTQEEWNNYTADLEEYVKGKKSNKK